MGDKPRLTASVQRSGAATGGAGSIVNTGVMYLGNRPAAHSVYLRQVQQVFPWQLFDRQLELAELAAFCAESHCDSYIWFQGPAWAGKSALMAWFVLHPPQGVRVVSFFITARFAGQGDRAAFLEVVLEQLAEVAGQPMPDRLTDSNEQAWFGQLLHDAAEACQRSNQRLVLVVDGLDEDRGVSSSPDAHSITALLPAALPAGVRVIVASRPDPPLPPDVPQRHPLRDKKIVRSLSVSPHAQMVRDDAERELGYLLDDRGLGRRLLGLVTVAGGGLSRDNLVELTGESPWTVAKTMRSVLGRTFQGRLNRWRVSAPPVFVLAHEELHECALTNLSQGELSEFLHQLHGWADQYRQRGWPEETPEYLLSGYHRLLVATCDLKRLVDVMIDRSRFDRMLNISGSDAAAMVQIAATWEFTCDQDHIDLAALLKLAIAREWLAGRNECIPSSLAAVWAKLGDVVRAEGVARSSTTKYRQAQALADVAQVMVEAGDMDRARQIIEQAETIAVSDACAGHEQALAGVARAMAKAGDVDRALAIAGSITDPEVRVMTLGALAEAMASAGDADRYYEFVQQARNIADSILTPVAQTRALVGLAWRLTKVGDVDRAEAIARSVTGSADQKFALIALARALAKAGDVDRAEAISESVTDKAGQAEALAGIAEALAEAGNVDQSRRFERQAEELAFSVAKPLLQEQALRAVAAAAARAGDAVRAVVIANFIMDPRQQALALAGIARALAIVGDLDFAEDIACSIADPSIITETLVDIADTLAEAGDMARARLTSERAEAIARAITDPMNQIRALRVLTWAVARAGGVDLAEVIVGAGTEPEAQALALAGMAEALMEAGDLDLSRRVAQRSEAMARSISDPLELADTLLEVVEAVAKAGCLDQAESIARSITDPFRQERALEIVATAVAVTGDANRAEIIARAIASSPGKAQALEAVAAALASAVAKAGDTTRALAIARSVASPFRRADVLMGLAEVLAQVGNGGRSSEVGDQAEAIARSITEPATRDRALQAAARVMAMTGNADRSIVIARSITSLLEQVLTLAGIVEALADAGALDHSWLIARQAEAIGHSIADPVEAEWALRAAGEAVASTGDADWAETIADSIANPTKQADALVAVAEVLIRKGFHQVNPERIKNLLASALSQDYSYLDLLPLIAKIQPATVLEVVAEMHQAGMLEFAGPAVL